MSSVDKDYLSLLLDRYWFAPPVALWRAIELRTLAAETFPRPIMDLGCGDGLIASVLFEGQPPIEMGFDPWWNQLRQAAHSGLYGAVQQAMGDTLPYASNSFQTVFSNSVLEHIPDLDPVLAEVGRVLKPGGRFIATVPSDAFRRMLYGYRAHVAIGDLPGAEAYAREVDQLLEHYRYPTPKEWEAMLAPAGIKLIRARYYMPTEAMELWDQANQTYGIGKNSKPYYRWLASPRLKRLGYQGLVRRRIVKKLSEEWRRIYNQDPPEGGVGGGLLVVGEKQ